MNMGFRDKRLKLLNSGARNVKGWQIDEEVRIIDAVAVLAAARDLATVSREHPSWRVHHHKPRNASSPWSIDITGNRRLLFYYDKKTHTISGMVYDDPHP